MNRMLLFTCLVALVICTVGCPDYSHLRPVPDYENMTDGGGEMDEEPEPVESSNR